MNNETASTQVIAKPPKAFISYSWTSPEHEAWVIGLAERLMQDGVDIVLDKWDLKEGQDKYAFMEKMVTDNDISKVLVVCDRLYADKADGRQGSVGTETQIISKSVYDRVDQEKFIPLITEYSEDGKAYVPTFFSARIYIDFSSEEKLNENYEQLLRSIYNRPLYKKPPLGKPPLHIFDDTKIVTSTSSRLQMLKDAVTKDKAHLTLGLLRDYFSNYINALEQFRITDSTGELLDEVVIKSITDFLPYRDEFVDLSLFVAQYTLDVNRGQNRAGRRGLGEGIIQPGAELGAAAGIPPAASGREVCTELNGDGLLHRLGGGGRRLSAGGCWADEYPAEQGA